MAGYSAIANAEIDPGKAVASFTGHKFRDNLEAVREGDLTAPSVYVDTALTAPVAEAGKLLKVSATPHPIDTTRNYVEYASSAASSSFDSETNTGVDTNSTVAIPAIGIAVVQFISVGASNSVHGSAQFVDGDLKLILWMDETAGASYSASNSGGGTDWTYSYSGGNFTIHSDSSGGNPSKTAVFVVTT